MPLIEPIVAATDELTAWRHDFHAHPEIGFHEVRTSGIVADRLASWGIEVHREIGRTGVVGVLRGGNGRRIGLRADMDALPMDEATNLPYRSKNPGVFHGCGHDGHTTMLLGAARYLAQTRRFDGTVVFIFQPAEEGLGGARAMLADGLFERFPCDEIYGLHNSPQGPAGAVAVRSGAAMAAADFFDIRITGRGAHGAAPHRAIDPTMVAVALAQAMQTIVSRNVDPLKATVVSITQIHAGSAYNVIPDSAALAGTLRTFDEGMRALVRARIRDLAAGLAKAYGAAIEVDIRDGFSVLENQPAQVDVIAGVADEIVGEVDLAPPPVMASEDFADMLHVVPGAFFWLGGKPGPTLHNPSYLFDDAVLPVGASMLARIAERRAVATP
ncbi:MAG: M20 aminoacylase family protein [Xanthobacteraceae bacterium]|jgi:hippurate hydrolase